MQIRKRLQINAAASVLMVFVICLVLSLSLHRLNRANDSAKIAGEITASALESVTLRNDYLRNNTERAKEQWFVKQKQISGLLKSASANFPDAEDRKNIAEMMEHQESIGKIFSAIVANREKSGPKTVPAGLAREVEGRLVNQLNMRVYDVTAHSRRLLESSRKTRASATRFVGWGVISVLLTVIAVTIINSWTMGRSIAERIRRLSDGAAIIGGGDLAHRIDVRGGDELAELSGAFNAMTVKLQWSYRDLENEIKERMKVEAQLEADRKRWVTTLASIGDAVIATDGTGRIAFLNPVAQALTGWQPEEALEQPVQGVFRIINEESHAPAEDIVARVLREGSVVSLANHTALVARDGREIPIEDSAAPIRDREGAIVGVVLVFHDVSERRRARQALQESEKRYRSLFDTMTEGVSLHEIVSDDAGKPSDFRYLAVNPAFESQTGLKGSDIIGRTAGELFPDAKPDLFERYKKVALTGEPAHFEESFGPMGRRFQVSAYQTEPGRFAVVFLDITERKLAEQALAQNAAKLAEVNRELEEFNYRVSNDLRVPLRAIAGFSRMLLKKGGARVDDETRRCLRVITENIGTMGRLIDDLMTFSRLGRQVVTRRSLDMEELVREIWQEVLTANPGREMALKTGPMPAASGDWSLIRQAYANLLENAVKFTRGRHPAVIEAGSLDGDEGMVYYVRDNGIGFDRKFHDKLFGLFQRLHTSEEYEGTGIGLAIVQRIINRHGGRVWAEGEADKGATFYFTLPAGKE